MNFVALGISVTSQRDTNTCVEYCFAFPLQSEPEALQSLLENMQPHEELSMVDPTNSDCSLEVRRMPSGFEIKRGCHGAFGTWRPCSLSEAHSWLLPGALGAAKVCRPGYGASYIVRKEHRA